MVIRIPPIEIFLRPDEKDILKKAYAIIDEMCSKTKDCGILDGREISHEELFELLQSLKLLL